MGYTNLVLLLVALLGVLEGASGYPLDPNVVAALQPPKSFFASPFFNSWARFILAGFGFSFMTAAGVILAIKRKENKLANLEDYYDQLEEYFAQNHDFFPHDFPDDLPTHNFPFPADLPGPGGWFGYKHLRPDGDSGFFKRSDDTETAPPSATLQRRRQRSIQSPPTSTYLEEAMQEIEEAEDMEEVMTKAAGLLHVVERQDNNGCLLKLLCHLQEKPKGVRTAEEELLVNLYSLNAPKGSLVCGDETSKCFLKEALLEEAFLWGAAA